MLVVGALAIAVTRRSWGAALVLGLLAVAGAAMIRFVPVAATVALPLIASATRLPAVAELTTRRPRWLPAIATVAVVATLAPAVVALARPGRSSYGAELVAELPSGCRLFNSYTLGGPVILDRPDVPVSLDSRTDVYGADTITELGRLSSSDLVNQGVTCVLLRPTDSRIPSLRTDARWRLAGEDDAAVLFLRAA